MKLLPVAFSVVFLVGGLSYGAAPTEVPKGEDGGGVGNGGGSWVCVDQNDVQKVIWVKLLDLHEMVEDWKLKPGFTDQQSFDEVMQKVGERMRKANPVFYAKYIKLEPEVLLKRTLTDDANLLGTPDWGAVTKPSEDLCPCGVIVPMQFANYREDERFLAINKKLYTHSSVTDVTRAANVVHEVIYKLLRQEERLTDSMRVREIVAHLFSDLPAEKLKGLLKIRKPQKKPKK